MIGEKEHFEFPDHLGKTTKPPVDESGKLWEAAGRKIAPMLGSYSAAVITSSDELAAAYVAIGIGLSEAEHRRVAIGDLVGEVEPIQSLVNSDDPHGISDSFTYGVSLNKIAQPIDTTGNLFVMPSGTGSVLESEIFRNTRWQRLANGFREVGALLILVAPSDAPGLKDLIAQMDGVVLVGDNDLPAAPYAQVLARVSTPQPPAKKKLDLQSEKGSSILKIFMALVLIAGLVGAGFYVKSLDLSNRNRALSDTLPPAAAPAVAETLVVPPPANMDDSLIATPYSVEFSAYNTHESAILQLKPWLDELSAATISPVPIGQDRETYYKVIAGAFSTQKDAEAFLIRMRKVLYLSEGEGTVVRTPFALLLDSAQAGNSQLLFERYASIPHPVYVLAQRDGSLRLYSGAFERPEDAATLLVSLREANFNPVVAYRTGRLP